MAKRRKKTDNVVPLVMNRAQMNYVHWLYKTGLHGATLYETHQHVFCAGLRALLPMDVVRSILKAIDDDNRSPNGEPSSG